MTPIESIIAFIGMAFFLGIAGTLFVLEMRSLYFINHNQSSYPTMNENKPDTLIKLSDPHATHAFLNKHGVPFDPAYTPPCDIEQARAIRALVDRIRATKQPMGDIEFAETYPEADAAIEAFANSRTFFLMEGSQVAAEVTGQRAVELLKDELNRNLKYVNELAALREALGDLQSDRDRLSDIVDKLGRTTKLET